MERHNNQQSGRMPRACKRGRPPKADLRGVRSSGRGQSACMAHAELHQEQDNRRYGEPIPEVTLHYPNTGATPSPMQQPSVSYGRTPKRSRTESAELSNIMLQNQSRSRYCTQQEQYSSYRPLQTMCDRNPNVTQILYPNMMQAPRTSTPCSISDQYPTLNQMSQANTTTKQHTTGYRYNTRGSVHNLNLPLSTPPNPNYWNLTSSSQPVSIPEPQKLPIQSKSTAKKKKIELKETAVQTAFTLTDEEMKLLKTLRAKRMDPSKVNNIIANDEYIVTYNDDSRVEIVNNLVKASQDFKISLLTRFYFMVFRAGLPGLTTNPAITYQDPDNNNESDSSPLQQLSPMLLQSLIGDGTPPPNAADSNTTSQSTDTPSPQPQVPQSLQQSETRPENLTLPIPSIAADWNNYRRYQAFRYPGRTQIRPNFNTTCQFLQNNTQMHHDSNYSSRVYHPEQFGMPGWF